MIKLFALLLLFSAPVFANHGGLWHEPTSQPTYRISPRGYSGRETEKAQQRELERQIREQREREKQRQRDLKYRYYSIQ